MMRSHTSRGTRGAISSKKPSAMREMDGLDENLARGNGRNETVSEPSIFTSNRGGDAQILG